MAEPHPTVIDPNSLNPALNPFSPLFLHHSDITAVSIVIESLNGKNFTTWSHSVKRALSVKNKLPLIDGTVLKPIESEDRAIYLAWIRANDLVLLWILNSIDYDIKKTLEYFTVAKEVWDELHVRYAKCDLARVFQLERDFTLISKGNHSLVHYYNQFKTLWDEYLSFRPVLKCNCGAMDQCTCEILKYVAQTQEQDSVMKFLNGLDDSYSALRS